MIRYSPAKINIGLNITGRRPDGFHNLQSVMLPIGLRDIIEIRPAPDQKEGIRFSQTGLPTGTDSGLNLCEKAYGLMAAEVALPPVRIHLHKQIPVGAGLGGGSSDASTTLEGLNRLAGNPLPIEKLHLMASELGSDCPFFLYGKAMLAEGRGEILSPVTTALDGLMAVVLFPGIHISTAEAYAGITPSVPVLHLRQRVALPVPEWKNTIKNDFEETVFRIHPVLASLKKGLLEAGALYASMSGSGSSLFGIFHNIPELPARLEQYVVWKGTL